MGSILMKLAFYTMILSVGTFTLAMDEQFFCKVPHQDSNLNRPLELNKTIPSQPELTQKQGLKQFADKWGGGMLILKQQIA